MILNLVVIEVLIVMGYSMFTGTSEGQVLMPAQQALSFGHSLYLLLHKNVRAMLVQFVVCLCVLHRFYSFYIILLYAVKS